MTTLAAAVGIFADSNGTAGSLRIKLYWLNEIFEEEKRSGTSHADIGENKVLLAENCMQLPLDCLGLIRPEKFKNHYI